MSTSSTLKKLLTENHVEFIDLQFTGTLGKVLHITYHVQHFLKERGNLESFNPEILSEGIYVDGSSVPGWSEIDRSDIMIIPDPSTAFLDPFTANPTLVILCDVVDPNTKHPYSRDPRATAKRAEAYLQESGIAETSFFGPELEFFIFDDVRYKTTTNETFAFVDAVEGPYNTGRQYDSSNMGHRSGEKKGYCRSQPIDTTHDIRSEILNMMIHVGLEPKMHHPEVAPGQGEVGFLHDTLTTTADHIQKCKYIIHNVAHAYGKTATFMPKPVAGDNGSGMHVHQSLWKDGKTLFAGQDYAGLSETALYYIGGIITHAKALNAFTNPTTNSYKRLIAGYEAPVFLTYSASNRSAAVRIPHSHSDAGKRIEVRFPDPAANPYLAFAAMLMAGLDGIKHKIHPGEALEKNLYALSPQELSTIPALCDNLRESLWALSRDRDFLKCGNVFTDDQLDAYITLKLEEDDRMKAFPHPMEFSLYYSV